MMHHYHLSTHHVFQMPRSDVRSETLAALQSIIEVATGGQAVPLPGFPEYFLSIRNTWVGAVGWLIQGPEHRVMVQCVTAWTIEGAAKGVRWLGAELPEELDLPCCLVKLGLPLLKDPVRQVGLMMPSGALAGRCYPRLLRGMAQGCPDGCIA